jgi:hypothetical protein
MNVRPNMRVSDAERQAAADRLRSALDEGRLDLFEYDDRLVRAYQSTTYADLDRLFADLPEGSALAAPQRAAPGVAAARPGNRLPAGPARLPTALKVLWAVWMSVIMINLTVWSIVSGANGELVYFWPVWVLVPGAPLLGVTVGALVGGRDRVS